MFDRNTLSRLTECKECTQAHLKMLTKCVYKSYLIYMNKKDLVYHKTKVNLHGSLKNYTINLDNLI